jgi:uncharacterized protein YfiM (DUF2279 family)
MRLPTPSAVAVGATCVALATAFPAGAAGRGHHPHRHPHLPAAGPATFSVGQLRADTPGASGCGTNQAGEPSIHVSRAGLVGLASENGLGNGSEFWSGHQAGGTTAASACGLTYDGQPNAFGHVGASGGDVDVAIAPVRDPATNHYRIYTASLNLASVNVATSVDDGKSWSQVPVVEGVPVDDREWIAAYGPSTALLSYTDVVTGNIDELRSDDGGQTFFEQSQAITDNSVSSEIGNLVVDHRNASPKPGGFWAYQSYVAQSSPSSKNLDEAFLAVSQDGGATWVDRPIPCTKSFGQNGLDHNFPNVSVAPDGTLFYAVSNDKAVYVAMSKDHGTTWTCSGPVSSTSKAIFPWIVATSAGEDLVYYGASGTGSSQLWSAYFAQNLTESVTGWSTKQVVTVHRGPVCESGISCNGGRQLFDDFGVDTDQSGWAHIAYSHDSPDLGGAGTYTGYAVQTGGTAVGAPN